MIRKIVLFACVLFSLGAYAQESKIAYVRYGEIFSAMPETAAAEATLTKEGQQYQNEITTMQQDYQKKYAEFVQQSDTLAEAIKVRRMQDLADMEERTQNYYQQISQVVAKRKEELNAPIMQKIMDAIKAVGQEHNYTYVLGQEVFVYISPSAPDVTQQVKTKLGLK